MKINFDNVCTNCGENNPLHNKNCLSCKHYLRSPIANIDFWSTIGKLIDNPKRSLLNIIYADHKNFVFPLLVLASVKLFLISISLQSFFVQPNNGSATTLANASLDIVNYLFLLVLFTIIITLLLKKKRKCRYKDNISVIAYSLFPIVFGLLILSPVEYGIFGEHWFDYNPSPFIIKPIIAYILISLEVIMIIWSVFLFYNGLLVISNSKLFSSIFLILYLISIVLAINFIPHNII